MSALRVSNLIIGTLMMVIAALLAARPNVPSVLFIESISRGAIGYGGIAAFFALIGAVIAVRSPQPRVVIVLLIPLWTLLFSQCWFLARNLDRPLWTIGYFAGSSFFILATYWRLEMRRRDALSHTP